MRGKVLLSEIVRFLGDSVIALDGNISDKSIECIAMFGESTSSSLDWVNHSREDKQHLVESSKSLALLVDESVEYSVKMQEQGKVLIHVENPYFTIAMVGNEFFVEKPHPSVHESAVISDSAKIGKNASIGANCVIDGCTIGDDCIIAENVVIRKCVTIGNHVTIKSGAILGETGFGFVHDDSGGLIRFPQIGRLLIGNNVEIGSHTCIDRGSFSDTIIEDNVKINNLCHIAHNVRIGSSTIITAHVNISGSTSIGSKVWIGPNATFVGHHKIGNRAMIGAGANVVCDVPSNEVWVGNPARFLRKNDK